MGKNHLPTYHDAFGVVIERRRDNGTIHTIGPWCRECWFTPGETTWPTLADFSEDSRSRYTLTYLRTAAHSARWPKCRRCGEPLRKPARAPRPARKGWYVNVYNYVRTYGGPEEGGWWYDRAWLVEAIGPMPEKHARRMARRLGSDAEAEPFRGSTAARQHYE